MSGRTWPARHGRNASSRGQIGAGRRELLGALTADANGVEVLLVLPRDVYEHWVERLVVLDCRTWGELRDRVSAEVHAAVLDLAGHGAVEAAADPAVTGRAVSDGEKLDRVVLTDDAPFDASRVLPACVDGDWPPSLFLLIDARLPHDLLDAVGHRGTRGLESPFWRIPGDEADAVLRAAQPLGIRLTCEPDLALIVAQW